MKINLQWQPQMAFTASNERDQAVRIDGPPALGGKDQAPRPMEFVLMGLASCSMVDVVEILRKSRALPDELSVTVEAERGDEVSAVFRTIHLHFVARGSDPRRLRKAVQLSVDK